MASFLGLAGFSALQESTAGTGIQVYCTENNQMLLKIRLAWPILGQGVRILSLLYFLTTYDITTYFVVQIAY